MEKSPSYVAIRNKMGISPSSAMTFEMTMFFCTYWGSWLFSTISSVLSCIISTIRAGIPALTIR